MGCWSNDLLSRLAPKNPIIASLFRNIGYADQLGSGVRNLYKYSKYYSGKEPEFIGENIESAILDLIALDTTLSQSQIAKRLNLNLNTVKYYIRKLRKTGQIERIGSSQKGKWVVVDKKGRH